MELGSEGRNADMLIRSVLMRRVEQVGADATISPEGEVGWAWVKYAA